MTDEQITLFGSGRTLVNGKQLTDRQQLAWDHVRSHHGVTDDEVGAILHAHRGRHHSDERCTWCAKEGLGALRSQPLRVLATRKRGGAWVPRDPADSIATGEPPATAASVAIAGDSSYDPETSEIPF